MWILWDLYSIWSTLEKTWGLTRTNQCKTFTPLQPPWNPGISRPSPRTCVVLKRRRANWHAVHGTFFYQPAKGKGRQVWGKHTLDPPPGFATSIPNPTSPTSQIIFFCHWTSKLLVDHIPQLFVLTLKEAQAKVLIWFSDLRSQVAQIPCNKRIYKRYPSSVKMKGEKPSSSILALSTPNEFHFQKLEKMNWEYPRTYCQHRIRSPH